MDNIYSKIKEMITKPSKKIMKVPFDVTSYHEVISVWKKFKTDNRPNGNSLDDFLLHNIFQFHLSNINHVILYYSKNKDDSILLCKIDNKYVNMLAPIKPLDRLGYSLIATYC